MNWSVFLYFWGTVISYILLLALAVVWGSWIAADNADHALQRLIIGGFIALLVLSLLMGMVA